MCVLKGKIVVLRTISKFFFSVFLPFVALVNLIADFEQLMTQIQAIEKVRGVV